MLKKLHNVTLQTEQIILEPSFSSVFIVNVSVCSLSLHLFIRLVCVRFGVIKVPAVRDLVSGNDRDKSLSRCTIPYQTQCDSNS